MDQTVMRDVLDDLKQLVFRANLDLVKHGLVIFTWGNASGIDRAGGRVVIKPSGLAYDELRVEDLVVVDLAGKVIEGERKPSSDTATHLELYKAFPAIGGVVHTHSTWAVAWSQAGLDIPNLGTTQADYFAGDIPCTRDLLAEEIDGEYEKATGRVIAERFQSLRPEYIPGVLVKNHGPFAWGRNASEAVHNAVVMEEAARMAALSLQLNPGSTMNPHLIRKHFYRKHGPGAYYGQDGL